MASLSMKRFSSSRLSSLLALSLLAGCASDDPPVASGSGSSGADTNADSADAGPGTGETSTDAGDGDGDGETGDGDFDIPDAPCEDPPGFTMAGF